MKKVYCKNCKYKGIWMCNLPRKNEIINPFDGRCIGFKVNPNNSTGECKYYERKWWKFWVRKG